MDTLAKLIRIAQKDHAMFQVSPTSENMSHWHESYQAVDAEVRRLIEGKERAK